MEEVCGSRAVRLHRASIYLSDEVEGDSEKSKQIKRKAALRTLVMSTVFNLAFGILVTTGFLLSDNKSKFLVFLSCSPSLYNIALFIVKVVPELLQSRGSKYLTEIQTFEKYKRADFSQRTGFMGEVKKEIHYLFDFVRMTFYSDDKLKKRRPIHLAVFIDDLDRCNKSTVMEVLQASILLLVDAPITCWLAVDTRRVVTSINDSFGKEFTNAGIDGYRYLEKIIQLPFCLPELTREAKKIICSKCWRVMN